eukprot:616699_1
MSIMKRKNMRRTMKWVNKTEFKSKSKWGTLNLLRPLTRIGLKSDEVQLIEDEEFESVKDILSLSMDELKEIGLKKMGPRKRIKRRLDEERERRGGDGQNSDNNDGVLQ